MTIKIITDGCVDLPIELQQAYDITVVPLFVHFGTEQMSSNEMTTSYFFSRMKEEKELPKTSSPSPYEFYKRYQEAGEDTDVIVLCTSSKLSSTYCHAIMAKEMLQEEGYKGNIEIFDSKSASVGLAGLAVRAAKMIEEGVSFQEILTELKKLITDNKIYFSLDTLENVIKGGRLDRVRGAIASVLHIKLVMRADEEGSVEVVEKVRGTKNAMKRLIEIMGEKKHDLEKNILGIAHGNCEERARAFLDQILDLYPFKNVIVSNMGPVIGTYGGEGAIVVSY
ncbi:DegV family protein [Paenibacillus sp. KN14-4R]|uniref:DegV family protein n=1 Tax=Paenibacillus sp. KN14-4R TaxID=3445773 RepID=UPI003FA106A1